MKRWRDQGVDVVLAVAIAVACVAELFSGDRHTFTAPAVVVAVLFGAPLVLRRTRLLAATAIYAAVVALHVLVDNAADHSGGPWFGALLLGYAVGRYAHQRYGLPEVVVLVVANMVLWGTNDQTVPTDFFFPEFFTVLAWGAGRAVRYDVRLAAEVHEDAARVLERAEQERERARAAERRRIAREMHDVIAHSVSVMVVQAGGARRILATDAGRAAEAASLIEQTGRAALSELRTLLGVLDATPNHSGTPAPSLAGLDELIGRARDAGLDVSVHATGVLDGLPAGVDMAAFRIVQEALTNALRHAGPVSASVAISRKGDAVELDIVNGPRPAGRPGSDLTRPGGHGMMGMAERANLYGGQLDAGPTADGGFRVRTTLTFEHHRMETAA
jgi:signal transduction histidine kinase